MEVERFNPQGTKFRGMSQATKVGGRVYVSGQVALKNGAVVGLGDAKAQAEQTFANIESVLDEVGAKLSDVVKLTGFLTDKDAYGGFSEVKNRLFENNPPASTVVIVNDLLLPGLLMEVEVEAWFGD